LNSADITSKIFITADIAAKTQEIQNALTSSRVVVFAEDEFKIEQAKAVISEAYISESETKYIVMCANSFNTFAQNTLLKILEEPPRNIEFIIITSSKFCFLLTILSKYKSVGKDNIIKKELIKSI
jgi:DNA polymerase-3 subunit delta'